MASKGESANFFFILALYLSLLNTSTLPHQSQRHNPYPVEYVSLAFSLGLHPWVLGRSRTFLRKAGLYFKSRSLFWDYNFFS